MTERPYPEPVEQGDRAVVRQSHSRPVGPHSSIRPSAGRVPDAGCVPTQDWLLAVPLMHVHGPMARRVSDARLGLQVLRGAHPQDPWSITAPLADPPLPKP
jgi:amidase